MNPLIKKEIRLLMPAWVVALLLATVPAWVIGVLVEGQWPVDDFSPGTFIVFGILLLSISSFGQEIGFKTLSFQLAQPVSRSRVWWSKILMLGLAILSLFFAAFISWYVFAVLHPTYISRVFRASEASPLWTLALISGGLWTTLLLRQIFGAFWITILVPLAIFIGTLWFSVHFNSPGLIFGHFGIDGILILYSIAGILWSYRLFTRAQDTQWTGGDVLLPWRKNITGHTGRFTLGSFRHPIPSLIAKEIQLHEVNLLLAAILLVVNLAAIVVTDWSTNAEVKQTLDFVWVLWLVMPLLIGSSAVAEERRLGALEAQLCLPVSRSRQFSIKFFTGLALSLVFGAVMPALLQKAFHLDQTGFDRTGLWIVKVFMDAPAIYFVSFFASTLARTTLQAIGQALAITIVAAAILSLCHAIVSEGRGTYDHFQTIGVALMSATLGVPILLLVAARLMFRNFQWQDTSGRLWWRNLSMIALTCAFVLVLANITFHRPWEFLTPARPPHGPAQLHQQAPGKIFLISDPSIITAALPDGRLWTKNINFNWTQFGNYDYDTFSPAPETSQFAGSNWTDVSVNFSFVLGIHTDGSLWAVSLLENKKTITQQIGSDTDWQQVAPNNRGFLLLKRDGTLWIWGTNNISDMNEIARTKLALATPPARISDDIHWTALISSLLPYSALVKKNDGSYWTWRNRWDGTNLIYSVVEEKNLDHEWMNYAYNYQTSVEVKTNGELWFFSQPPRDWNISETTWNWPGIPPYTHKTRLGKGSNWKAVTYLPSGSLLLLRQDGTLWTCNPYDLEQDAKSFKPTRLGHDSDWVALSDRSWVGLALAADGSLWSWGQSSSLIWLAPSRLPVYMGNIFQGTKD